ncbi:helix-turn-helix transcriptional regulator [Ramlibacter sp. MAHUQ-53]|uniref:helix-turn-helix transcriptional regulator n=1 Tax=unclassified Ramlibacter TaxID=2617605 RepID=UPI003642765D
MKTISLSGDCASPVASAMWGVVEAIGDEHFVPSLLGFCREAVGASDCSLFVHAGAAPVRIGTARLPGLEAHSVGECYVRDGFYRVDPTARVVEHARDDLLLNCLSREELPDHQWARSYEDIGLAERLSLIVAVDGGWGVLNAYRPSICDVPLEGALAAFGGQARLVASALRRHLALAAPAVAASPGPDGRFALLSPRERQVVDAILDGRSAKECARDMGLSPTSVATYRQRAFEKLGIQRQRQLFQLRGVH